MRMFEGICFRGKSNSRWVVEKEDFPFLTGDGVIDLTS